MASNGSPHNATGEINVTWIKSEITLEKAEDYPNQEYILFMCDLYHTFTGDRSCTW